MSDPVLSGEITKDGMLTVLAEIEEWRTTGLLRFEAGDIVGEVKLVAGQMALEQDELEDGRDPVEVMLALREGQFEVIQRLPVLPVSKGDEKRRKGSLAVHVPADLMNWCERAGLTGTLRFENTDRQAEAIYDRGELVAIRVDGTEDDDLHEVFGWEEGGFEVVAHSMRPPVEVEGPLVEEDESERDPTIPRIVHPDVTGKQFLKSVEVALQSILDEREKRRSPDRTGPPLPPPPKARRPNSSPGVELTEEERARANKQRSRREPTVRVIYLGRSQPPHQEETMSDTRHVQGRSASEEELPDAKPSRRREGRAQPADAVPAPKTLHTLAWVGATILLFLVALAILAKLPALE